MNDCCEKCRFWRQPGLASNPGECHRRAPAIQSNRYWPAVNRDDWCGEFEMREDVKPCMKCGKPSGADGMGVMENYVIIGRVCKACREKVKEESCMFCQGRLDAFSHTLKEKGFEPGGKVCSKCAYDKNLRPRFT
jgi:hypothetical protein